LAPPGVPKKELIITLERKLELLESAGVDLTVVLDFTREISRVSASQFLDSIVQHFHPVQIVIGYDHHFGYERAGDAQFLQSHAKTYGYEVDIQDAVNSSEATVSSTQIRKLLKEGHSEQAEYLLGRPYEIAGVITRGVGRGRELQYPTANLELAEPLQLIPQAGVYVVSADIQGQTRFGMCNVGVRPTFNGDTLIIEAHFFNIPNDDLYDCRLTFRFHHRLRAERRFDNPEQLTAQLDRDKESSLEWIKEYQRGGHLNAPVA
jgi:riboflavin kinase/FMN adenylyltransferase